MQPKLPNIEVPGLNGNIIRDLMEFKNLFKNLIHTNETVRNVQKAVLFEEMFNLQAVQLMKDFSVTEVPYSEAWKVLCERYNNEFQIIRTYLSDLFALQKLKSEIDVKKLLDEMDQILRGLKVVGVKVDRWAIFIA